MSNQVNNPTNNRMNNQMSRQTISKGNVKSQSKTNTSIQSGKTSVPFHQNKHVLVAILVITILIAIGFLIFTAICYFEKILIFTPYVQPDLPNTIRPLGGVRELTPAEQAARKAIYNP